MWLMMRLRSSSATLGEAFERFPRGGDRFVRVVKNPVAAREALAGHGSRPTDFGQHLGHHVTNKGFVDLHGSGFLSGVSCQ